MLWLFVFNLYVMLLAYLKLLIKLSKFIAKKNTDKQDSEVEAEAKKEEGRRSKLFFVIQLTHI